MMYESIFYAIVISNPVSVNNSIASFQWGVRIINYIPMNDYNEYIYK